MEELSKVKQWKRKVKTFSPAVARNQFNRFKQPAHEPQKWRRQASVLNQAEQMLMETLAFRVKWYLPSFMSESGLNTEMFKPEKIHQDWGPNHTLPFFYLQGHYKVESQVSAGQSEVWGLRAISDDKMGFKPQV